jgi:hypothetical protein
MRQLEALDWREFLIRYPGMRLSPAADGTAFKGHFEFCASPTYARRLRRILDIY